MRQTSIDDLVRFSLELLGLTLTMGAVMVIAAFYAFDGFALPATRATLLFCLLALFGCALPLQVYAALRISRLRRQNARLHHAATRDGLTQVLNRTAFKRAAEAEIGATGRRRARDAVHHTLLILDADHFKKINDRLGHHVGDEALTAIAATLRRSVRQDDLVGRLGGEEFAILLKDAGLEEARIVAERLRMAIARIEVGPADRRTRLSISAGGIAFRGPVAFPALYKMADANLYQAKRTGRNRVELTRLGALGRGPTIEGAAVDRRLREAKDPRRIASR
ncbi:GGDEF domain-containing protein [Aureimonas sp. AU22]|jgi:diguanylate cyclase (GGDEF)-like protein|uniref:GGDEF domain-containing protein n=1 Tax=Aureimonas sp. AU22 TaxID=1638162 RepID=UPI000780F7D8|nr:GGDEF domain-containing protein [Aureimonas sp. AU22]